MTEWKQLPAGQRAAHFAEHGSQWSEFARLPYFDLIRMTILDPMHVWLLNAIKNQWFERWIKNKALRAGTATRGRELDAIHEFLDTVSLLHSSGINTYEPCAA
jgi:hypothetical protein